MKLQLKINTYNFLPKLVKIAKSFVHREFGKLETHFICVESKMELSSVNLGKEYLLAIEYYYCA